MMKKGLYILMGCLLFAACSKNSVDTNGVEPISFGAYAGRAVTKADATNYVDGTTFTNIPSGASFGVFGYFHPGNFTTTPTTPGTWSSSATPNLMNNVQVTAGAADGSSFTYTPYRYWPLTTEDRISFIGYYPYAPATGNTTGITPNVTSGFGSYTFVANPDKTKQVDFLISDLAANQSKAANYCTGSVNGTVNLTFHHVLANVSVEVTTTSYSTGQVITVDTLFFKNICSKGVCTPSFSGAIGANGATNTVFTWSKQSTVANFAFFNDNTTYDNVLLMIPQSFEGTEASFEVHYSIKMPDKDPNKSGQFYYIHNNVKTVKLSTTSVKNWENNKRYKYSLTLSLDQIFFDGTVEDWAEASSDIKIK